MWESVVSLCHAGGQTQMARLSSKHLYPTESPPRLPFTFSVSSFNLTEKKRQGEGSEPELVGAKPS